MQQRGLATDHQDGVQPADRLELDHALAETALAGVHDLFQFGDQRLWCAVADWVDADRLAAHPVDIEAHRGFYSGTALGAGALDQ